MFILYNLHDFDDMFSDKRRKIIKEKWIKLYLSSLIVYSFFLIHGKKAALHFCYIWNCLIVIIEFTLQFVKCEVIIRTLNVIETFLQFSLTETNFLENLGALAKFIKWINWLNNS